jgi:hypothetical protein
MLFKHKHLLKELRKSGRRATAEIISVKTVGEGRSIRALWAPDEDLSSGWIDCVMRLRVIPEQPGEPPFEATAMTRVHALKYLGGTVPVWYDPENTARVVVDYEADLAAEMHWMADAERLAHRHDRRLGLVWTPLGGDLLPIEVLAKPGQGRVAVKGRLDKLVGDHAAAVVEYVRGHAIELAPGVEPDWLARNDLQFDAPYGDVPADLTSPTAASAGLAIAAALVSAAGELLPVRGFREQAHCAKRGYAKLLVAPKANEADVRQVSEQDRRDLQLVFAATPAEALHAALAAHPASGHSHAS